MDYQLDLREYRCPLPLLMTKRALAQLEQGDRLYIWVEDLVSVGDFQLLSKRFSVIYLGDEMYDGAQRLSFQKV